MNVQTYARIAGVLFLLSIIGGGFGEAYVPMKAGAAMTVENFHNFESLIRIGFAGYLVEAMCDVGIAWILYVLLRPVQRELALLAAFFGLVSTALFGFAELFYFSSSVVLRDASFSSEQRNALAHLFLKIYGAGSGIFMCFYGVATLLRGVLIFRSGYLPKFLGVLFGIAGAGFVANNFLLVLAPRYASDLFMLPVFLAVLSMTVWLLAKGVDVAKWEERVRAA